MSSALSINPTDFLHSLCKWISAATALAYTGTPRAIWRMTQLEPTPGLPALATDPATVLTPYPGGPLQWSSRVPRLNVQVRSSGTDGDLAFAQCQQVFEAFVDVDGLPVQARTFNAFKAADDSADGTYLIVFANLLQRPGKIGVDDRGRSTFTFNLELCFKKGS